MMIESTIFYIGEAPREANKNLKFDPAPFFQVQSLSVSVILLHKIRRK